jgi:hypothetical protein
MSATTTDITGNAKAFSSFLRIPAAGYRKYENGSVSSVGSGAYLWSRSANEGLNIISGYATLDSNYVIGSTICPSVYTACITTIYACPIPR